MDEARIVSLHAQVEQLYEDARQDVYYYLLTFGIDPGQAQDLSQETFLRLYMALREGQQIRNERAWIFRVAHNLGLNARASQKKIRSIGTDSELPLPVIAENPERNLLEAERRSLLDRAIAELSPQQRQCLLLRVEGLRYREIAGIVGISISTVAEFLRRAVSKLKRVAHE
ncbi:MAG TPA: RNA polymerase sigma factor [Bryobacteraceae bacterium]|nr:RNA polymerase sigma factor [Bryobacteraceae bacterium]